MSLLWAVMTLILVGCTVVTARSRFPTVSVMQVWTGLARDPSAWRDHEFIIRGEIAALPESCRCHRIELLPDGSVPLILRDDRSADGPGSSPYIALVLAPQSPVLATLRRWPILHSLIPAPQSPIAGRVATYWIRVQAIPHVVCDLCYDAVLLDTTAQKGVSNALSTR